MWSDERAGATTRQSSTSPEAQKGTLPMPHPHPPLLSNPIQSFVISQIISYDYSILQVII